MDRNKDRLTTNYLSYKDSNGNTPLYIAIANRNMDTVKYLLERGVPIQSKNENDNSALHKAFMN